MHVPPWENGMVDPAVFIIIGLLLVVAAAAALAVFRKKGNEPEKRATMLLLELSGQIIGLGTFAYYAFDPETATHLLQLPVMVFAVLFSLLVVFPAFSRGAIFLLLAAFSLLAFYYAVSSGSGALMGKLFIADAGSPFFHGSALLWLFALVSMTWHGWKDISSLLKKKEVDGGEHG